MQFLPVMFIGSIALATIPESRSDHPFVQKFIKGACGLHLRGRQQQRLAVHGGCDVDTQDTRKQTDASVRAFLRSFGIVGNLLTLTVIYSADTGSVSLGANFREHSISCCSNTHWAGPTHFSAVEDREYLFDVTDHFLHRQPVLEWDSALGPCTLLMLDPDAPSPRGGDGARPGSLGPWLHWLITDAISQPEGGRYLRRNVRGWQEQSDLSLVRPLPIFSDLFDYRILYADAWWSIWGRLLLQGHTGSCDEALQTRIAPAADSGHARSVKLTPPSQLTIVPAATSSFSSSSARRRYRRRRRSRRRKGRRRRYRRRRRWRCRRGGGSAGTWRAFSGATRAWCPSPSTTCASRSPADCPGGAGPCWKVFDSLCPGSIRLTGGFVRGRARRRAPPRNRPGLADRWQLPLRPLPGETASREGTQLAWPGPGKGSNRPGGGQRPSPSRLRNRWHLVASLGHSAGLANTHQSRSNEYAV